MLIAGAVLLLLAAAVGVIWAVTAHNKPRPVDGLELPPANPTPKPVPRAAPAPLAPPRDPTPAPRAVLPANPTPPRRPLSGAITEQDVNEIRSLVLSGRPISALKLYRDKTGASLAEAKEALASIAETVAASDYAAIPLPPTPAEPPPPAPAAVAPPPMTPPPLAPAPTPAPVAVTPPLATPPPKAAEPTPPPKPAEPEPELCEDDETVRAMIHFGRQEEAVQMYMEIHGVDLKTARAAVDKMH